jgi:transposase
MDFAFDRAMAPSQGARVTDPKLFKNGRHLSAWIGAVPGNIRPAARSSRRGSPRRAIAICAHSSLTAPWPLCAMRRSARITIPGSRSRSAACRKSRRRFAIANKTTRIAWAIMVHGGVYEAGHRAARYRAEARVDTG